MGFWHSEICINAVTKIFHMEKDPSYTLIGVPNQENILSNHQKRSDTLFLFKINHSKTIGIRMVDTVSFLFHGAFLTHRQYSDDAYCDIEERKSKVRMFNIACYGNERLFQHMKKSLKRNRTQMKQK